MKLRWGAGVWGSVGCSPPPPPPPYFGKIYTKSLKFMQKMHVHGTSKISFLMIFDKQRGHLKNVTLQGGGGGGSGS